MLPLPLRAADVVMGLGALLGRNGLAWTGRCSRGSFVQKFGWKRIPRGTLIGQSRGNLPSAQQRCVPSNWSPQDATHEQTLRTSMVWSSDGGRRSSALCLFWQFGKTTTVDRTPSKDSQLANYNCTTPCLCYRFPQQIVARPNSSRPSPLELHFGSIALSGQCRRITTCLALHRPRTPVRGAVSCKRHLHQDPRYQSLHS